MQDIRMKIFIFIHFLDINQVYIRFPASNHTIFTPSGKKKAHQKCGPYIVRIRIKVYTFALICGRHFQNKKIHRINHSAA